MNAINKRMSARSLSLAIVSVALTATAFLPTLSPAAVVVVVSAKSSATKITADQAAQLFLAKTTSLPGVGDALLINQAEGSAIREAFYTKVVGKNAAQVKAIWSRLVFSGTATPPKEAASSAEVKRLLGADDKAVGYMDSSDVDASVKVLLSID